MTTWILILTLIKPVTEGGVSVTAVAGFDDATRCKVAGAVWQQSLKGFSSVLTSASFVCVAAGR